MSITILNILNLFFNAYLKGFFNPKAHINRAMALLSE